tara:strand:- start:401 stop:1084 length:684 start_codon:yes stop_codon:yes gene_type:complete
MSSTAPSDAKPATPRQYLDSLPKDRRDAIQAIRRTINARRDKRLKEGIQYGMLGWCVPHTVYPAGYHCDPSQPLPFASVASQKNHIGIYLFCLYTDEAEQARFVKAWKATGKKLDMGKSCIRIKKIEDVPLDVLGDAIERMTCEKFIKVYDQRWGGAAKPSAKKAASRRTPAKKTAPKKAASKKTTKKKPSTKKTTKKKAVTKKPAAKKKPATKKAARKATARTRSR